MQAFVYSFDEYVVGITISKRFINIKKVVAVKCLDEDMQDDYGMIIKEDIQFIEGHFLEVDSTKETRKMFVYQRSKKRTFFYKESVVYPFVGMVHVDQKKYSITKQAFNELVSNVEMRGYQSIF